jgi:peptide/nickel transport system substrate-binding protein
VDQVDIALGRTEASAEAEIAAGLADFTTDLPTPVATVAAHTGDPLIDSVTDGATTYLLLNAATPVLSKPAVRQALNLATDKAAVVRVTGGPSVAQPVNTILTPQILGYRPSSRYVTPGDAGDPAAAVALLGQAGFQKGLALRLAYADSGANPLIAQAVRDSWRAAGISVTLVPLDAPGLQALVSNRSRRAPTWDVALTRWPPSWYGDAARTFFAMLLRTGAPANNGRYSNPAVDALIKLALAEPDANRAADIWSRADAAAMADPPWVPLFTGRTSFSRSLRVQGWAWNGLGYPDYTRVWLRAS